MRRAVGSSRTLALVAAVVIAGPAHAAAPSLAAVALGNLPGGDASSAAAVSGARIVVGWATTAAGNQHAVSWRSGQITDLGTLPGDTDSYAAAVSETGLIVGASGTGLLAPFDPGNEASHAVLWRDGEIEDLGTLPGGTFTVATGVNDAGQVVGCGRTWLSDEFPGSVRGFVWQDGTMTILEAPVAQAADVVTTSCALAINDDGDVVGSAGWATVGSTVATLHGVLWRDGMPIDLGVLTGAQNSGEVSINAAGQIVGSSGRYEPDLSVQAVRWTGHHVQALGSIPGQRFSTAVAVNSRGTAVGQCATASAMFGCRWQGMRVSILPPLGGDVTSTALGVNDVDLVVGYSQGPDATFRAVSWSPSS